MLDNLINLIRQNAGDSIINNPAIPNERNEEAVQETGNSIISSIQNALSGGQAGDVMSMFSRGNADNNNPVVQQASGNLISRLMQRFGLDSNQASGIAGSLIPQVMRQFAQKTADPNDQGFDAQNIFNQLSGGKTAGLDMQGILQKLKTGLDQDKDGDLDMQDLKGAFSGGAGGMMDKVKGMFNN